jgi:hypothetical protein
MELPPMDYDTLKELMRIFVQKLGEYDQYDIFAEPVGDNIPGYRNVIEHPMDFTTMIKKITEGQYTEYVPFENDMELVFTNCKKFNPADTVYYKEANRLHRYYRKWKKDLCTEMQRDLSQNILDVFNRVSHLKLKLEKQSLAALEEEPEPMAEKKDDNEELGRTRMGNKRRESQPSESKKSTVSMTQILTTELDNLFKEDTNGFFGKPVDTAAYTDYLDIIKEPMDFGTIRDKLKQV